MWYYKEFNIIYNIYIELNKYIYISFNIEIEYREKI